MAPKVPKKPLKMIEKIEKPLSKVKKAKTKKMNFSLYIHRVLKTVVDGADYALSSKSMLIMNSFVMDTMENIANEAGKLANHAKRNTLGSREIHSAVKLLVPGQLGAHAAKEGLKAITFYHNSQQ